MVSIFHIDRWFTLLFWILAILFWVGPPLPIRTQSGQRWKSLGIVVFGVLSLISSVYFWRFPHGLSASYHDNLLWQPPSTELDRYFEADGQGHRVDRFLDFNPNDFNPLTSIGTKPFSVVWQGYVNVPVDQATVKVDSNFGAWLYVDDRLIDGAHRIDFGDPSARKVLRTGWSHDEQWGPPLNQSVVWSSAGASEFYLGIDEVTDYMLLVRCAPFTYPDSPQQSVTVLIENRPVGILVLQNDWHTYALPVPAETFSAPGFFKIKFQYVYTVRPADVLPQSQETRSLAVAWDFAELRPTTSGPDAIQRSDRPEQFSSTALPRGLHRITLKAMSNGDHPFLRLLWQGPKHVRTRVIGEDRLFPAHLSLITISQAVWRERLIVWVAIGLKGIGLLLVGYLLIREVLPGYVARLKRRDALIFWAVAAIAFLLRVIFLLEMKRRDPAFWVLPSGTDHLNYIFFARGFFRGYWPMLTHAAFYEGPLVSFYFILCSILVGESLLALRLCTIIMSIGSLGLVFLLSRRLFSRSVAIIAAALYACNGVMIFYDNCLLMEPQVIFLNLLALWFMIRFNERLQWRTTIGLGVVLGLTALGRGIIALLMPLFFGWIVIAAPAKMSRKILHLVGLCGVVLLTILPVTIRNYFAAVPHRIVFTTTNSDIVLWAANNPSANGMGHYSPELLTQTVERMQETGASFRDDVVRYITTQPWHYLNLEYRKLKMFWAGYEIGNNISYYWMRSLSRLLQFPWINFLVIAPLGIVGVFLSLTAWRQRVLLYGFVAIQLLAGLIFVAASRYRLPVVPILTIFAAYAIWQFIQHIRQRAWRQAILIMGSALLLYGLMNYTTAAHFYERRYNTNMPLTRLARYWDVFERD